MRQPPSGDVRLPRGFLRAWLDAFALSRVENHAMVTTFIARLEREGTAHADDRTDDRANGHADCQAQQPAQVHAGSDYAMGGGWRSSPDARPSAGTLLVAAWQEWRYLRALPARLGAAPRWVIADDRRTGCITGRERLAALVRPFGGGGGHPALAEIIPAAGQGLLCFTPNLFAVRPAQAQQGLAHLGYLSLFVLPLVAPLRFARAGWRALRDVVAGHWTDRHAWVTALLAASTATLLGRHAPRGLAMLTSNSFVIELMRYMAACSDHAGPFTEVMHGIPTQELEAYHAAVYRAFPVQLQGRLRFVPPVPGLRLAGYPPGSPVTGLAVNVKLNDTADRRDLTELARASAERAQARGGAWVVALNGAGTVEGRDYTTTGTFAMEQAILRHVRRLADAAGMPVHLQYSVHPAHVKSGAAAAITGELVGVEVLHDSFQTWLEADLCISIFSSASWEAHAFGAAVAIGIRADDAIYSEDVLAGLAHPGATESLFDVLVRELARMPDRQRADPLARVRAAFPDVQPGTPAQQPAALAVECAPLPTPAREAA